MESHERDVWPLTPRLLLDTHIVIRWLYEPDTLSRDQNRVLTEAVRRSEPLALSAISLIEIAVIPGGRLRAPVGKILQALESSAALQVIPIDIEIATEVAAMGDSLRDPNDRVIVATARVHRLRLVTSDQRIINSNLVAVVD